MNYLSTVQCGETTIPLIDCFLYATIDPGGGTSEVNSGKNTDKAGWTVGAVSINQKHVIVEAGEKYLEVKDMLDLIYGIQKRWKPQLIGIERMMYLQQYLNAEMQRRHKVVPLYTLNHKGRNKAERIKAVLPMLTQTYFTQGVTSIVRPAFDRWHEKMQHGDDWLDSFAYYYDIAVPPNVNALQEHRRIRSSYALDERIALLDPRSQREARAIRHILEPRESYQDDIEDFMYGNAA